jgi:gamma-glutamyltranspeptidase
MINIQQAIDFPRIHHQWPPDELVFEPNGLSADTQKALAALGHKLANRTLGEAQGIMIDEKTAHVWEQPTRGGRRPGNWLLSGNAID